MISSAALYKSVILNKPECLKVLLAAKTNPMNRITFLGDDETWGTPLHIAAKNGFLECIEELIKANALLEVENSEGLTPLGCAVRGDKVECVKALLNAGADKAKVLNKISRDNFPKKNNDSLLDIFGFAEKAVIPNQSLELLK